MVKRSLSLHRDHVALALVVCPEGICYGNFLGSGNAVGTIGKMFVVPANGDIVSFGGVKIPLYLARRIHLIRCEAPHIASAIEYGVPGVDGRHGMGKVFAELPGHDDGVTRELVVQGFFAFRCL